MNGYESLFASHPSLPTSEKDSFIALQCLVKQFISEINMLEKQSIVEEIYNTRAEDLPSLASNVIQDATNLLEDYAEKIVKKGNILKNRWILINLLHVLYKDIFLLQTEDFEMIIKSSPKHLDKDLSNKCNLCNKELSYCLETKNLNEDERIKGLCLDCFISTVKEGDWWNEFWGRLKDQIKS